MSEEWRWHREVHEILFEKRFLAIGETLTWIPKERSIPTHDFVWRSNGDLLVELKSTRPRAKTITDAIQKAASRASSHSWAPLAKEHFVVDLGSESLAASARVELSAYNAGRIKARIRRLWVLSGGVLDEIELEE